MYVCFGNPDNVLKRSQISDVACRHNFVTSTHYL